MGEVMAPVAVRAASPAKQAVSAGAAPKEREKPPKLKQGDLPENPHAIPAIHDSNGGDDPWRPKKISVQSLYPAWNADHASSLPQVNGISTRPSLRMQFKLAVGAVNDPLEREADAIADRVMQGQPVPTTHSEAPALRRKCACEGSGQSCEVCKEDKEKLQRKASGTVTPSVAPPVVHNVLRSPGKPLDTSARSLLEPRFGFDFSHVRVHEDSEADRSAQAVHARAYTVNSHLVFAAGEYRPTTSSGQRLIAHELAHVVQQTSGAGGVLRRVSQGCTDLANPSVTESVRVSEKDVQEAMAAQIPGSIRELPIPTGSYAHFRDKQGVVIDPKGKGFLDLALKKPPNIALKNSPNLEILEIKRGDWEGLGTGLEQLANYLQKGNSAEVADWRAEQGVNKVVPMPQSRYPGSHVRVGSSDEPVTLRWCIPGLVLFKAIREQDRDLFVCTARDQGKVDAFLRPKLGRAFDVVDEFIDKTIGPKIEDAIRSLPLGQVLQKILQNPSGRAMLEKMLPGAGIILDQLDVKTLGDLAEHQLGALAPAIRGFAMDFKRRLIDQVRNKIRDQLMNTLQEELNVLCATVTVLTMDELLKKLRENMPKLFGDAVGELVPVIAAQMAKELLAEAALALAEVIAAACGIVLVILGIIAAAAAIAEIGIAALIAKLTAAIGVVLEQLGQVALGAIFASNEATGPDKGDAGQNATATAVADARPSTTATSTPAAPAPSAAEPALAEVG